MIWRLRTSLFVREEKGTQTQTFWSGYLRVGWGSSTWKGGGQKVGCVLRNPRKPNFLVGYPGIFAGISRRCPKSLRKKMFGFNSRPLCLSDADAKIGSDEDMRKWLWMCAHVDDLLLVQNNCDNARVHDEFVHCCPRMEWIGIHVGFACWDEQIMWIAKKLKNIGLVFVTRFRLCQRKLKGNNKFRHFFSFSHFSTPFTFFPPGFSLKIKPFLKRVNENKKITKPFCTLIVTRLSSFDFGCFDKDNVEMLELMSTCLSKARAGGSWARARRGQAGDGARL